MSRETPDEPADAEQQWRRLLREPDALPGQGLTDKDAAWDTLFERLNAKPRRNFFGYRIVAACILIALIPVSRLFHERSGSGPTGSDLTREGKGAPIAEKVRPAPSAQAIPAPVAEAPARRTRKKPLLPKIVPVVDRPVPVTMATPAPSAATPATPVPAALILAENTPPQPPHPPKPAPKKQWKVVDINELDPPNTRPPMVADRQPRRLRLGLGPGDAGLNPPARGEESRLKINLTPQNH